jgi:hypothetical protein
MAAARRCQSAPPQLCTSHWRLKGPVCKAAPRAYVVALAAECIDPEIGRDFDGGSRIDRRRHASIAPPCAPPPPPKYGASGVVRPRRTMVPPKLSFGAEPPAHIWGGRGRGRRPAEILMQGGYGADASALVRGIAMTDLFADPGFR